MWSHAWRRPDTVFRPVTLSLSLKWRLAIECFIEFLYFIAHYNDLYTFTLVHMVLLQPSIVQTYCIIIVMVFIFMILGI